MNTSSTAGTDHIVASFTDSEGKHTSNEVTKKWIGSGPPPTGVPGWEGWHTNFGAHCSARVQVPFLTGGQQVAAYTEVFCNRPSDVTVGMPVQVTWEAMSDGRNLPQFEPRGEGS